MNDKALYIGVDSGGTRTNIAIRSSPDLGVNVQYEVSESLDGSLAPAMYPRVLRKILARVDSVVASHGLQGVPGFLFISAAGFSMSTRDHFSSTLQEVCPEHMNGRIVVAGVANDAVSLLMGLRAKAVVIAGTGSNIVLEPESGFVQIGGHDWVACDQGSGFWIGLRAIRQAFRDLESGSESTLLQRLYDTYGIRHNDSKKLIEKAYDLSINDPSTKREIARFAASVCGAAERGDVAAQNIVKAEAEELADLMAVGLRRHFSDEKLGSGFKIVQAGSVIANPFYRSSFENQIEMRLRSAYPVTADLQWVSVVTGLDAAAQLAQDLASTSVSGLRASLAYRPVVIRF
jgi:N-acetylglucosamine kinase-like BadF-type ATPase